MTTPASSPIALKAYRVKGGAIVRVFRGSCVRRYRVSGRRFVALRLHFAGCLNWTGYWGRSRLDIRAIRPSPS